MAAFVMTIALSVAGCTTQDDQGLVATGELVAADGHTPLGDARIDRYSLTFWVVGDGGREFSIRRELTSNGDGEPITTNGDGKFRITSSNLALAYDWERDEYVCEAVCVAWDQVCRDVTEETCDTCTDEECGEQCRQECYDVCWEEEVCDESECWSETVCTEECEDVCETVCEPVKYDCNCRTETYEVCDEQCTETTQECEWVTQTYTAYPDLSEVTGTEAVIWMQHPNGGPQRIIGKPFPAQTGVACNRDGECDSRWMQHDLFVMPEQSESTP